MFRNLTDVVKNLLIINVLAYFGTQMLGEPYEDATGLVHWGRLQFAVFYPTSPYFEPYQIVTHMFMHGNITHLFFNMYALYIFGPHLEHRLGSKRFLTFYLLAGFGALLLHMGVMYVELNSMGAPISYQNVPTLGASGAVFGLLAGFGTLFPNIVLQLLFPPVALKAKWFVIIYAGLELFLGISGAQSGVAHFAHVGGALFGYLLLVYWRKTNKL